MDKLYDSIIKGKMLSDRKIINGIRKLNYHDVMHGSVMQHGGQVNEPVNEVTSDVQVPVGAPLSETSSDDEEINDNEPNPILVDNIVTPNPDQSQSQQQLRSLNQSQTNAILGYMEPTHLTLYTIPANTILYHGSKNVDTFDPNNIKLGDDTLISFFSAEKKFAMDYINGCILYPQEHGYIHKFRTIKDIDRVFIVSQYDINKEWSRDVLNNKYCNAKTDKYNGIGFFVKTDEMNKMQNNPPQTSNILYSAEFALCNPKEFLQYVETESCIATRKLSPPYGFDRS